MWFYTKKATEDNKPEQPIHNPYDSMTAKTAVHETEKPVYKIEKPAEHEKTEIYKTAVPHEAIKAVEREAYKMPEPITAPDTAVPNDELFVPYFPYTPNTRDTKVVRPSEQTNGEDIQDLMDKNGWWISEE